VTPPHRRLASGGGQLLFAVFAARFAFASIDEAVDLPAPAWDQP
jgi:hypothetical protein